MFPFTSVSKTLSSVSSTGSVGNVWEPAFNTRHHLSQSLIFSIFWISLFLWFVPLICVPLALSFVQVNFRGGSSSHSLSPRRDFLPIASNQLHQREVTLLPGRVSRTACQLLTSCTASFWVCWVKTPTTFLSFPVIYPEVQLIFISISVSIRREIC